MTVAELQRMLDAFDPRTTVVLFNGTSSMYVDPQVCTATIVPCPAPGLYRMPAFESDFDRAVRAVTLEGQRV